MTRFILVTFAFLAWSFWYLSGGFDYAPSRTAEPIFAPVQPLEDRPAIADNGDLLDRVTTAQPLPESDAPASADTTSASAGDTADLRDAADRLVRSALAEDGASADALDRALDDVLGTALSDPALADIGLEGLSARGADALTAQQVEAAVTDALSGSGSGTLPDAVTETLTGALTGQTISRAVTFPEAPADPARAARTDTATPPGGIDLREIVGDSVNMRSGPGTGFSVLAQLGQGAPVEVLGTEPDGWLRLRVLETGEIGFTADWLVSPAR